MAEEYLSEAGESLDKANPGSNSSSLSPFCVFCGIGSSAKFCQGDLIAFQTTRSPLSLTQSNRDLKVTPLALRHENPLKSCISRPDHTFRPSLPLNPSEYLVGRHCSLDSCRRLQEGQLPEADGRTVLTGLPNAFVDAEGRPFGYVDELREIGWPPSKEKLLLENLIIPCASADQSYLFHAHRRCVSWSKNVKISDSGTFEGVEEAAVKALQTECALCRRLGASILCSAEGCSRSFHFPCATAAGCYQENKCLSVFCPSHLDLVVPALGEATSPCFLCGRMNNVSDTIFCNTCGIHFHTQCLEPPLVLSPTLRIGWQCPECKTCHACSENKDETKMVICDICDKGFHTYCLKPPVASIPKNGFKCERCRICTDCGLRQFSLSKGASTSSEIEAIDQGNLTRWHHNYTLCDRCFNNRKRSAACCVVCERAWRCCVSSGGTASPSWPGRRCDGCRRMVHYDCDPSGQSALSSPHSSSPSLRVNVTPALGESGIEDTTSSLTTAITAVGGNSSSSNYFCPACRSRDSATPSEALSATASLRTSPFVGGAGSSDLGDASSAIASASPSLADDPQLTATLVSQPSASSAILSNKLSSPVCGSADPTSITPLNESGKQLGGSTPCGTDTLGISLTSMSPRSPRGDKMAISGITRSHKSVGRPSGSLTKSKSLCKGLAELPRKRLKTDSFEASKPPKVNQM